jgi:hypothetical protein
MDFEKDDVIFNAAQVKDLVRTGKAAEAGKIEAHANGTVPGMHAFAGSSIGGFNPVNSNTTTSTPSTSTPSSNDTRKKQDEKKDEKKKNNTQEELENWVSQLFDWIEIRLKRVQEMMDLNEAKANNTLYSKRANKYLE